MTIAEKLIVIADKSVTVAEKVNEAMTTDNGAIIRIDNIDDTAPIKIQAGPATEVKVHGKNLIETASVDTEADGGKVLFQGSVTGDFVFSCLFNYSEIKTPTAAQFSFIVDGATVYQARGSTDKISKKLSGTLTKITFLNWGYGVGTVQDLQLEVGSTPTEFEAFKGIQTSIADANGKVEGIEIVSPVMTIVADQPLECKYFPANSSIYDKCCQIKAAEQELLNKIKEEQNV